MTSPTHDTIDHFQSDTSWHLKRDGHDIAVIEPAWDDMHHLLFLADSDGALNYSGAYGRLATLKVHLRLWARRTAQNAAPAVVTDERPE